MEYFIAFLEGIITFVSPCLLPMLPIYISYFAGQTHDENHHTALFNALGFVLGFTLIFVLLGAFAGSIGSLLIKYNTVVNLIGGIIIIIFGLNFMDILHLPFLNVNRQISLNHSRIGFFSSLLFGIVFFHWLDALRRCVFRVGVDAGRIHWRGCKRYPDAVFIFAWIRNSFYSQCCFN